MTKGKIYVYTVNRPTATKVSEVVNSKNIKLNQTKASRGITNKFKVGLSKKTGRLATGLNVIVDNPYKDGLPPSAHSSFKKSDVEGRDQIKLQYVKELEYGLEKDYLTDEPYDRDTYRSGKEPTFYQKYKWECNDGLTIFDRNVMRDDLAYYAMLESKRFANSKKELDGHKWPEAIHYIGLEQEDEEVKYKKRQLQDRAKGALTHGEVADPITQRKFIKVLLPELSKGILSDIQAYNSLSKAIDDNQRFKTGDTFITKFNKTLHMLETPEGREQLEALVLLQDLQNAWIISEKAGTYKWLSKDMVIGQTKEQAVNFLLNPEKQDLHDELQSQLDAKSKTLI